MNEKETTRNGKPGVDMHCASLNDSCILMQENANRERNNGGQSDLAERVKERMNVL
jgi:hypothetical protein